MNARGRSTIVLSAVLAGAWIVAPASRAQETRVPDDAAIRGILEQRPRHVPVHGAEVLLAACGRAVLVALHVYALVDVGLR